MRSLFGPRRQRQEPREDLIARLCRECGRWRVSERDGDIYRVRAADGSRLLSSIGLRYQPGQQSVPFQCLFPVRFSLENPPSGLFARLLMRNFDLIYASWTLFIGESCEATLRVVARVPTDSLTATLFDAVCREIRDEITGFHAELQDKFRYGVGGGVNGSAMTDGTFGMHGQGVPEVRFVEPVQHHSGQHARYQLPNRRG